jgi:hypothetical protein
VGRPRSVVSGYTVDVDSRGWNLKEEWYGVRSKLRPHTDNIEVTEGVT